ncbi:MAG: ssDNA-binding protein [Pseudomonadota bacterium]
MGKIVLTEEGRVSYLRVFEGQEQTNDDGNISYGTTFLIPKEAEDTIKSIRAAILEASQEKFDKIKSLPAVGHWYPLRDGDEELEAGNKTGKEYEGHYFLSAKAYELNQFAVIGPNGAAIDHKEAENADQFVSGDYARLKITFKAFDRKGNKGVRCVLKGAMKTRKGDPLGSVARPEDLANDFGVQAAADNTEFSAEDVDLEL